MTPDSARKILDLPPGADIEAARRAFRAKVKLLHPDRASARTRTAYQDVVAAWRALQDETREPEMTLQAPAGPIVTPARPEPVHVSATVSWLAVRMGETIEVEAPHRPVRLELPTDARPGERLRIVGTHGEPDVVVTLQIAQRPLAEAIQRFVQDFPPPKARA